jgi:hypothetical protein
MTTAQEAREHMPWRREGMRVELQYMMGGDEKQFTADFNFYEDGRLGEIFARPFKTGVDLEALLDRFCITVSYLLQLGMEIGVLWQKLADLTPPARRDIFSALIAGGVEAQEFKKAEIAARAAPGIA